MAYGYVIAQINIHDPEAYATYVKMVQPTLDLFDGQFLVRGGKARSFEGAPPGDRHVIIQFPSYDKAMDWYASDAYAPAKRQRLSASTSVQTIVEGIL